MHILFAVPGYKPAYRIGGPIVSVSAKAETLVKKGHRVTVFTTNSNLTEDLDVPTDQAIDVNGVEVWYFKREEPIQKYLPFIPYVSKSMGFLYTPKLKYALESIVPKVDLVHTHLPFIYPTHAAGRAALRHNKPLFYHQRGVFDPERLKFRSLKKRIFIHFMERPLLIKATTLIALTEAEVHSYRELGVNSHCEVIPNGIDVNDYWQNVPDDWHSKLDIPLDVQVILFMGRLHPIKGADRLLKAFLEISKKHPKAVLVLAGPDEFDIQEKLRHDISSSDNKQVIFTGMVSGDKKRALLARANLFCLPSDAEGFSMAILEALASETPVLISPGCHFPAIEDAGAGRIVPKDIPSITTALTKMLQKDNLKKMGKSGLNLVKESYTWDHLVDKLVSVYEEGISRSR